MTPTAAEIKSPVRSHDQRMAALRRANKVRYDRADVKRDLKAGGDAVPNMARPPEFLKSMKARDYLLALPRVGAVKADAILRTCRISSSKTLGGLSDRQRDELVKILRSIQEAAGASVASALASAHNDDGQRGSGAHGASERYA